MGLDLKLGFAASALAILATTMELTGCSGGGGSKNASETASAQLRHAQQT